MPTSRMRQYGAFRRRPHPVVSFGESPLPPGPQPPPLPPTLQDITWLTPATRSADPTQIVDAGDFDVQGWFRPTTDMFGVAAANTVLFTSSTPDGTLSVRYTATGGFSGGPTIRIMARGVDAFTVASNPPTSILNYFRAGDDVVWRAWYRPSAGQCGIRMWVNGVVVPDVTGSTTGGALAAPTSVTIGMALADTTVAQRFIAATHAGVPVATTPEFVIMGDSTVGPGALTSVGHDLYTIAERNARPGIGMLAVPSDQTAGQQSKFDASPWSSQDNVVAVITEVGINDHILGGANEATVASRVQTLINDVHTKRPLAKNMVAKLVPFALFDSGASTAFLLAFNNDVAGTGSNNITGVDFRIVDHYPVLDDGTGNGFYKSIYNFDNLHENNLGRTVIAGVYRTALESFGLLP